MFFKINSTHAGDRWGRMTATQLVHPLSFTTPFCDVIGLRRSTAYRSAIRRTLNWGQYTARQPAGCKNAGQIYVVEFIKT